ncbi:hypothetical protein BOTCAL_0812g00040 [Botryotinia calthae]|uniref:Uncharacterized protein n=1 Tax=Botryotinia calthae TaxID=38488 RepID=A0A4Y8CFT6_9HELO|nr:hypothetical protein BOTCAL_0812g00040 [Botryotinia calthae]
MALEFCSATPDLSGAALARLATAADVEGTTEKYFKGLSEIKSSKDSYDEVNKKTYGIGQSAIWQRTHSRKRNLSRLSESRH